MRTVKVVVPLMVLVVGLSISSWISYAKPEYTKKEKKACVYCHVKATSKQLNDIGRCYKDNNHSLAGCDSKKGSEKKN